jgi:O-antigen ligase
VSQGRWIAAVLRLIAGILLAWFVGAALAASQVPFVARGLAVAVVALTVWRPSWGIAAVVAVVPAGLLLANPPVRAADMLVWAFLAAWLLALRRPLTSTPRDTTAGTPLALFALCAVGSWAGYIIAGAAGIDSVMLPVLLLRAIPIDHLVFSSPEPETWAMLTLLTGLAFFAATRALARRYTDLRRMIAMAIVASVAVLALVTVGDVLRQWNEVGYGGWFLLRYVRGERFSAHVADLNAAGSQYVLAGLIALSFAVSERGARRAIWIAALVAMMPAWWLSGSRSAAIGALLVGAGMIPCVRYGTDARVRRLAAPAGVVIAVLVAGAAIFAAQQPAEQGSASNALRLRSQFLVTSARMTASAPIFGVGIGHYHERSNEFMPPSLREVYRNENAHNYFAQQFAELGLVGGGVFVWLVVSVVRHGWRETRRVAGSDAATLGLFAGSVAYLVTCVTGHPLLVPEAALPFWAAFGALAGASPQADRVGQPSTTAVTAAVAALIAIGLVLQLHARSVAAAQPGERGFYGLEAAADGRQFTWMTRHGVFYARPQAGVLTIPLRPPDLPNASEPFEVAVEVSGHRVGSYLLEPGRWTDVRVPLRERSAAPFRRIDLRANQTWTRRYDLPDGGDEGPRSVMVGEIGWQGSGAR